MPKGNKQKGKTKAESYGGINQLCFIKCIKLVPIKHGESHVLWYYKVLESRNNMQKMQLFLVKQGEEKENETSVKP